MIFEVIEKKLVNAKYLKVCAQVRYWDDAVINGESNDSGDNVPFKNGSLWVPVIEIDTGKIIDWPVGVVASFYFKVCDAGSYYILDEDMNQIKAIEDDYVPSGLCHGEYGYGDYIIFSVTGDGFISGYKNLINEEEWTD